MRTWKLSLRSLGRENMRNCPGALKRPVLWQTLVVSLGFEVSKGQSLLISRFTDEALVWSFFQVTGTWNELVMGPSKVGHGKHGPRPVSLHAYARLCLSDVHMSGSPLAPRMQSKLKVALPKIQQAEANLVPLRFG